MKILPHFIVDSFGSTTQTKMISKYFLLAFVCVSLGQVQGNELENAIYKGLIKTTTLYERGLRRIENIENYQSEIIETNASIFKTRMQKIEETSMQTLRRAAQNAEDKAKEADKPPSVFECIARAEKNANNQIQILTNKFRPMLDRLEKIYCRKVELIAGPLGNYRCELKLRYEKTREEIRESPTPRCVENAFNNFSVYTDRYFECIGNIQNQINSVGNNFQREARTIFNNTNRQLSATQSVGLRQIRECVYRRTQI